MTETSGCSGCLLGCFAASFQRCSSAVMNHNTVHIQLCNQRAQTCAALSSRSCFICLPPPWVFQGFVGLNHASDGKRTLVHLNGGFFHLWTAISSHSTWIALSWLPSVHNRTITYFQLPGFISLLFVDVVLRVSVPHRIPVQPTLFFHSSWWSRVCCRSSLLVLPWKHHL